MDFINQLRVIDTNIFLFFNELHNSFFDRFMFFTSEKLVWIPLYATILFVMIKNWKAKSVFVAIALIMSVVIADQIASGIIKNVVERMRPSREWSIDGLVHIVNGERGGRYGFVSSHAANMFAVAVFSAMAFGNKLYSFLILMWAIIVSYSRIYLGVHYPGDVVGGIIVGTLTALFFYFLLIKLKIVSKNNPKISGLYTSYVVLLGTWGVFVALSILS
ncbi:MAG: phosphatase PAP2 family protein [Prevotellaceae bacterium]|jgi:undecaprenyl-diphosphatase|nr:phosphatase PAP2 family protein [Prevotellaceae bacterium]